MAASFPSAVKTFTTRANADVITPGFFNEPYDEITAIETFMRSSLFSSVNSSGLPLWQSYTPTWTNGVIGNGTLTGYYLNMGTMQFVNVSMTAGSTTTFGGGSPWSFSLPAGTTASGAVLSAWFLDGSTPYVGSGYLASSSTVGIVGINPTTSDFVKSTHPFTWATGDIMQFSGIVFKS